MSDYRPVRYAPPRPAPSAAAAASAEFLRRMSSRRPVREFSPDPVPVELVRTAVATAATAPSGAHQQPWTFVDGHKHYYVAESVGIACGLLLASLHLAGLAALTHTPSPMRFLTEILGRPRNERPYVVVPIGWPAADCVVPDLRRRPLDEVLVTV